MIRCTSSPFAGLKHHSESLIEKEWVKALESDEALSVVETKMGYTLVQGGEISATSAKGSNLLFARVPESGAAQLGNPQFNRLFGGKYAYFAGSMANGISSAELVIALGKEGFLGSFGAGGLVLGQVEEAILQIQAALPNGPYAINLIHSPSEPAIEEGVVSLAFKHNVRLIEASAFLMLTPYVVWYRAKGLSRKPSGIDIPHKIIAKVSRTEVATRFMEPAPDAILEKLVKEGKLTSEEAQLAKEIPMADAITVEADSGGHTDNRPLVTLLPAIMSLKEELAHKYPFIKNILIGSGGGIGTPKSAWGALAMGADYLVTGSINQACIEAGTSDHVRKLLAQAEMADVTMAPAADMFEMGVKLQVLKRGSLFAMRAGKLWDIYSEYKAIEEIPPHEREKIEKQIFQKNLEEVWSDCIAFFTQRDPALIKKAEQDSKKKMALIFRWYLGQASFWAKSATEGRQMDYQIWCGPAMGAFNAWVKGTELEPWEARKAADVARKLMQGVLRESRLASFRMQGVELEF